FIASLAGAWGDAFCPTVSRRPRAFRSGAPPLRFKRRTTPGNEPTLKNVGVALRVWGNRFCFLVSAAFLKSYETLPTTFSRQKH
ncbi:MAG: hypothetical protein IJO46_06250, partial [Thermoguttaceae bacterium]|nr:hypothetical protein [Thermoguttaceae bacterium]